MSKQIRRYMYNYDTSQEPPIGIDARAEVFSGLIDLHKKGSRILEKKDPFVYPSSNVILVGQGTITALFNTLWRTFEVHQDTELSAADLDTGGSFQVGTDYYVYLVAGITEGSLVISANSTFPSGAAADNSRKLGGFHYGHIRCVNTRYAPIDSNGVVYGNTSINWRENVTIGIVPNSVWDLKNRPTCSPEGMALVGNRWVDIYEASIAEAISFESNSAGLFVANGLLQSSYGRLPATGSEGLNWYSFQELAARSGKRLQTYAEFVQSAAGNPGGQDSADDYGWTKTSNVGRARVGCSVNPSTGLYDAATGVKPYAISAHNIVDTVGNVWEWVNNTSSFDNGSPTWAWHDTLGADKGQLYSPYEYGFTALVCGGAWTLGVLCGGRAVFLDHYPWHVYTFIGSRLACDKLTV